MLFRKKIERSCDYCTYGVRLDDESILCAKKGLNANSKKCRKFCYDPTKRIPVKPKAIDFQKFEQEDYSL